MSSCGKTFSAEHSVENDDTALFIKNDSFLSILKSFFLSSVDNSSRQFVIMIFRKNHILMIKVVSNDLDL